MLLRKKCATCSTIFCQRWLQTPALQWMQMNHEKFELTRENIASIEQHWHSHIMRPRRNIEATLNKGKKYVLSMFPYPSGNLHMGHVRVYTISDSIARYFALRGFDVLHPMGWDAFGLPAENAAIHRKEIPAEWIEKNISAMRQQMVKLSCSFDWDRELITSDAKYYRWTQWIFLQMYKAGLIYQRKSFVDWDPVDCTVLASEQIDDQGRAWRSGALAERKLLKQWFVKTTKYAKPLYDNLNNLNEWRDIVDVQREWIRTVDVYRFSLKIFDSNENYLDDFIDVFVKNPSDLGNAAFLSLSKDHSFWQTYDKVVKNGATCLTVTALNPITGGKLPIILGSESEFALYQEIRLATFDSSEQDSDLLQKLDLTNATRIAVDNDFVINKAEKESWGGYLTSHRLGDWVVSRQRYWGTPIPMIHCSDCGAVPVPESDLPVVLPKIDLVSIGNSPLKSAHDWINVPCPKCSKPAQRETDTLDTFFDSSWYFLRYLSPNDKNQVFDKAKCSKMMPVDVYVGGKEHACLHLFFARFFCHFLKSIGYCSVEEPFYLLLPQGMIMGKAYKTVSAGQYLPKEDVKSEEDKLFHIKTNEPVEEVWEKMSKSRFNGVNPTDVMEQYGADMTRLLMTDNVSPREPRHWPTDGYKGLNRWLNKVAYIVNNYVDQRKSNEESSVDEKTEKMLRRQYNRTVEKVSNYCEQSFIFNTALAELYLLATTLRKQPVSVYKSSKQFERCLHALIIMMSPFAPNITAEFWSLLNTVEPAMSTVRIKDKEVWEQCWPEIDEDAEQKLEFWLGRKPTGYWILMDRRKLKNVSVEQALDVAKKSEALQDAFIKTRQRIIGARLEWGNLFGVRVHLNVEDLPEEEVEQQEEVDSDGEQKKAKKKKKKSVFVRTKYEEAN